jgi:hypothetical protein
MYGLLIEKKDACHAGLAATGLMGPDRHGKSGGESLHNPAALVGVKLPVEVVVIVSSNARTLVYLSAKSARSLRNAAELVLRRSG